LFCTNLPSNKAFPRDAEIWEDREARVLIVRRNRTRRRLCAASGNIIAFKRKALSCKMAKSELSARSDTPGPVPSGSTDSRPPGTHTVTRVNLAEAVYQQVGLSRKESAALVEMVLDEMTKRLIAGESVRLSSFGSFNVRHKGRRVGRNPKTGVEVPIKERRVLVFKSSNLLKARINGQVGGRNGG
jgi:integration host factor subunit alpha